jgi:hypothetical protein
LSYLIIAKFAYSQPFSFRLAGAAGKYKAAGPKSGGRLPEVDICE